MDFILLNQYCSRQNLRKNHEEDEPSIKRTCLLEAFLLSP